MAAHWKNSPAYSSKVCFHLSPTSLNTLCLFVFVFFISSFSASPVFKSNRQSIMQIMCWYKFYKICPAWLIDYLSVSVPELWSTLLTCLLHPSVFHHAWMLRPYHACAYLSTKQSSVTSLLCHIKDENHWPVHFCDVNTVYASQKSTTWKKMEKSPWMFASHFLSQNHYSL